MFFVARIHNNSLGSVTEVASYADGVTAIGEMVKNQFNRELTPEEQEDVDNTGEFYNNEDHNNVFTFSIGTLDRNVL